MAQTTTMISCSYTDLCFAAGGNAWLKNAKGLSSCKSIAPMPYPEALVSTINCLEKSGRPSIGILVMAVFRDWNVAVAASPHTKLSFFKSSVKGQAMVP